MIIYIILISLLLLDYKVFKNDKKKFCIIAGLLLFSLVTLRNIEIGISDTKNVYYPMFLKVQELSFYELITYSNLNGKFFFLVTKCISIFISNYQVYLAVIGLPYIFCVFYFIYKNSEHLLISTILFVSLYYLYSFFLLRQVVAMGIILLSYNYLKERKLVKFTLTVLFATLFHKMAIVFLFAYPFCKYNKFGKKNYVYILLSYVLANLLPQIIFYLIEIFDFTGKLSTYIRYGVYDTNNSVSVFGLFITVAILIFAHYYKKESNYKTDLLFNLSTLGSIVFAFSSVVSEFYRLSLFFSLFNIILVSNVIKNETNTKKRKLFIFAIVVFSVLYFLTRSINNTNANPYLFFWGEL